MTLDSHTLLWWLERSPELSPTARKLLDADEEGHRLFYVSGVSFWELYRKEQRGILQPRITVRRWPAMLERIPWLRIIAESPEIWLRMAELDWTHADPADRLIASVALVHETPVLTRDRRFHAEDSPVEAVW